MKVGDLLLRTGQPSGVRDSGDVVKTDTLLKTVTTSETTGDHRKRQKVNKLQDRVFWMSIGIYEHLNRPFWTLNDRVRLDINTENITFVVKEIHQVSSLRTNPLRGCTMTE